MFVKGLKPYGEEILDLICGLNPVAAAGEAGIVAENHAMSTTMEYQDLIKFERLLK